MPILLCVGYAACHWCHVMAHESFEDEATSRRCMNAHFVSIKVDREERPDVDAVYMEATTALTGQGGWPMTCLLTPTAQPFFAGTYFPRGSSFAASCCDAITEAWTRAARRGAGRRASGSSTALARRRSRRRRRRRRRATATGRARSRVAGAQFDAARGGFGGAPKFPPSMVLEFLLRHARAHRRRRRSLAMAERDAARRWPAAACTTSSPAASRATRSTPPGWCRTSRRCSTTTPCCCASTCTGGALDRRSAGGAGRARDRRLPAARPGHRRGRLRLRAGRRHRRRRGPDLRVDARRSCARCSATTTATGRRSCSTSPRPARSSTARPRCSCPRDPADPARSTSDPGAGCSRRATTRPQPARDDKVVTAWNGLAIAALAEAASLLDEPRYLRGRASAAPTCCSTVHVRRRAAAPHLARRRGRRRALACAEDYGDLAEGLLLLHQATGDPRWLRAAGTLLDVALDAFADGDGGFFDTARRRRDSWCAARGTPPTTRHRPVRARWPARC